MGTGIVAWLLAVYFAAVPAQPAPHPVIGTPSVDVNSCRTALTQMGFSATVKGNEITAFEALSSEPRLQLEKASVAAVLCKIPMKSFCMGEGCAQPGMTLVLQKPVELGRSARANPAEGVAAASAPATTASPAK